MSRPELVEGPPPNSAQSASAHAESAERRRSHVQFQATTLRRF